MKKILWCVCFGSGLLASPAVSDTGEPPYIVLLGTAQDGGIPQIGCRQACCQAVRRGDRNGRHVTSLLLADPGSRQRWLFDATPDLPVQIELAAAHPKQRVLAGSRPPLFEGVFLTHAHMGHYTGLLFLGPEAYGANEVPVFATGSMQKFLSENAPWELLVERRCIVFEPLAENKPVTLTDSITVTPLLVPHRREYTDTCAFVIEGPNKSVLYLPDIDKWEHWEQRIEDVLKRVDTALLDGCFFAEGEIPGRSMAEIPHPFIEESIVRFQALPRQERQKILFTHLNHTNPAADPSSDAAKKVREHGMRIAKDGMIIRL